MVDNSSRFIPMGTIIGAFGIKGWVKIKSDTPTSFSRYKTVILLINGEERRITIEGGFVKDNVFNAKLTGIDDRDQACALRGVEVAVLRSDFPTIKIEGEYYWVDLIGLNVFNQDKIKLGVVENLMETGANDVLVIKSDDVQHLIPFIAQYVSNVDLVNKQIIVEWGLDY